MNVVLIEPGKKARIGVIGDSLSDMQEYVEGLIQAIYPFDDPDVALICNDEGKINGLELNRALYDEDGKIYDIIAGKCFICGCGEENFTSLTAEQMETYKRQFEQPENFFRLNGRIIAVKTEDQRQHHRMKP